jgi:hypothetical protein
MKTDPLKSDVLFTFASKTVEQSFAVDFLVGGLDMFGTWLDYDFPYTENVIIPTDFHSIIFQF